MLPYRAPLRPGQLAASELKPEGSISNRSHSKLKGEMIQNSKWVIQPKTVPCIFALAKLKGFTENITSIS